MNSSTIGESLKAIAVEIRFLIIYQLADLIVKLAPNNPEGNLWVTCLYQAGKQAMAKREKCPTPL